MKLEPGDLVRALGHLERGDWRAAHEIVQKDEDSPLACWAHGIVHLMEGDVSNARYWYREAQRVLPPSPSIDEEIRALKAAAKMGPDPN
jgi:hypothetical protein